MSFEDDNRDYETWLRAECKRVGCRAVEADLRYKHQRMKESAFVFLRATFFRWAKRIENLCPELAAAPAVLSVGDTHVENFGTWRDAEGRLVWGINDFDEAALIPYPFDLVRLATSIRLANGRRFNNRHAAAALLDGYQKGLAAPRPTLLDEQETWMRDYVGVSDKQRRKFWDEVEGYPVAEPPPPAHVKASLRRSLPAGAAMPKSIAMRRHGVGSLGRLRYVAVAAWRGGHAVREAKALVPSAWDWAHARTQTPSHFLALARGPFRSPDPFLSVSRGFVIRRLAADARKVDLDEDEMRLRLDLFGAMGFDLGAIHAGDKHAAAIGPHLRRQPADWLYTAARIAAADVGDDFESWSG
jgi:Uncharacterized protein conserved in bacteria (DUF2252)